MTSDLAGATGTTATKLLHVDCPRLNLQARASA
eukprot:CAMPEP_0195034748 /NCGR_PEP_ID=MMETSP0326_2-20130528/68560_1 /TAXON_ID=2866 ORGANISM="Crypthecodinium cohnii, Strain Seligo" /NCGR_SAMPLE_ID=MMETSP0326_2 /ASSEMBLY_ACC=CAM_ASM_000348 /LENGTH=32 /DNA_ID= /DNA_START= /DNA_END= /DNA_ORIENTATION=